MNYSSSQEQALCFGNNNQQEYVAQDGIDSFRYEMNKGCSGEIFNYPLLSIAPPYRFFRGYELLGETKIEEQPPKKLKNRSPYSFAVIVFNEEDGNSWHNAPNEILPQFHELKAPSFFEIIAIKNIVQFQYCFDDKYIKAAKNAIHSRLPNSSVIITKDDLLKKHIGLYIHNQFQISFYYPNPPYHRIFTGQQNKDLSNIFTLCKSLELKENELFYYRVALEPANDFMAKNCFNLHYSEKKALAIYNEINTWENYYLPPEAESTKAINEKIKAENMPMFWVQPMVAFWGEEKKFNILQSFLSSFRFGEKKYNTKSTNEIIEKLGNKKIIDSLINRTSHIQGHLLNRKEAAHFISLPCEQCLINQEFKIPKVVGEQIPIKYQNDGILLGTQKKLNKTINFKEPIEKFEFSFCSLGNPGLGKSTLLKNITSQLAQRTDCAKIITYYNEFEFIPDIISSYPESELDNIVLAIPFFDGKFLARNLVDGSNVDDVAIEASDLTYAILNAAGSGSAINVEYKLKNVLQILLLVENTSLDEYINVLTTNDSRGKEIRRKARTKTQNKQLIKFLDEIENGSRDDSSIHNKFQDIFGTNKSLPMVSYNGKNLFSYKDIIENHKTLIWYFGGIGFTGDVFASIELAKIYRHFYSYSFVTPTPNYPTYVMIDEAQRVKARGIADAIREQRRYGLRYLIFTQMLKGCDTAMKEAIDLIGTHAYFQCPEEDAKYLSQKAGGKIKPKDLMSLKKGEMIVRMLTSDDVYKCKTLPFDKGSIEKFNYVLKNSLNKYYINIPKEGAPTEESNNNGKRKLSKLSQEIIDIAKGEI